MQSPIEQLLVAALRKNIPADRLLLDYTGTPALAGVTLGGWAVAAEDANYIPGNYGSASFEAKHASLFTQVKIDAYRIDLVVAGGYSLVLVECDGRDFHERTKQQAAYDRERDRRLLIMGLPTIRFTGSEIVNYPEKCCEELFAVVRTFDRINAGLCRNGFLSDGRSYRPEASSSRITLSDGREIAGHWNPGEGND
jgi:very-short-patch-repair endonuclease